jgi:hypothetical protein
MKSLLFLALNRQVAVYGEDLAIDPVGECTWAAVPVMVASGESVARNAFRSPSLVAAVSLLRRDWRVCGDS